MVVRLTIRQREVLEAIAAFIEHNGYPPSVRDLRVVLNVSSTATVKDHLDALVRKGWIERDPGAARGIRVLKGAN